VGSKLKSPLVYWHLLSLDAPTVAVLWTWFIARVNRIDLPGVSLVAMAAAVWMLYAADRLLDVRSTDATELEARHYFHQRHRKLFLTGIALASAVLAWSLPLLQPEAIRRNLVLGGLVTGYFVVIHATNSAHRLPKEIAVGLCFAAAVFIPSVARAPRLQLPLLPPALLLALLCILNCLFIYAWEHLERRQKAPHRLTAFALRHLRSLAIAVALSSFAFALVKHGNQRPLYVATTISSLSLLLLDSLSRRASAVTMRASADFVLLTPLLLVLFL